MIFSKLQRQLLLCSFFLFATAICFAQSELTERANEFASLSRAGDAKKLVKYYHPVMIDEIGGKREVRNQIETNNEQLEKDGISILSHEIGEPFNQFNAEGNEYALVPQFIIMESSTGKFKVESYLLAIRGNKDWEFINTGNYPEEKLVEFFPALKGKLTIPEKNFETIQ